MESEIVKEKRNLNLRYRAMFEREFNQTFLDLF